mmetsp:Transcript_32444/g.79079  ORF Transcript_32444/g.79079 Transcript_32444/m.79079 type:complete len:327 (-) Transcript_32444:640-1620(-)
MNEHPTPGELEAGSDSPDSKKTDVKERSSEEYVDRCRHDIIEKLKKVETKSRSATDIGDWDEVDEDDGDEDYDEKFHILLSTVRALMKTNNEIWERCQPYKREHNEEGSFRFYRTAYNAAKASKSSDGGDMEFFTLSQLETQDFPGFPRLPGTLSTIFPIETNGTFQQYDDYLAKITWLAKPIAYQFLSGFKAHLEDIHVALGKTETWITEPNHSLQFINEQFGMDLQAPELGVGSKGGERSAICVRCFRRRDEHQIQQGIRFCRCPKGRASFFVGSKVTLKKVNVKPELGSMDVSFECSSESDQESLKCFMTFVQCAKSDESNKE